MMKVFVETRSAKQLTRKSTVISWFKNWKEVDMDCEHCPNMWIFLDGELADVEHAAIEAHLQQCESCREVISRESRFRAALRQSLRTVVAPGI